MADYIDRIELVGNLDKFAPEHLTPLLRSLIEKQPTADVVEVVRCKDCLYWENGKDYEPYCNHFGNMMTDTKADDFCSYGTPKERGADNG